MKHYYFQTDKNGHESLIRPVATVNVEPRTNIRADVRSLNVMMCWTHKHILSIVQCVVQ